MGGTGKCFWFLMLNHGSVMYNLEMLLAASKKKNENKVDSLTSKGNMSGSQNSKV
jgi:hypothetical protein